MTKLKKTSKIHPISLANDYSPSPFNIILVRHCESCANVANPISPFGGHIKKFWRQPLCTTKGVKQSIATGIILPQILKELQLNNNPPFASSILPRAFTTAKITSIPFDNPITLSSPPKYSKSKIYYDSHKINDNELYDIPVKGGAKISRTHPHKIIDPNQSPPDPNSIFRIAYIKETMNLMDPQKKFYKNKGSLQSQNLTSVHHSDSYLLATNHIFSDSDGDPIGRHISMNPYFLENIVGGDENTSQSVRKKIIKSSWDSFEKEVLPSLRSYCQNKNGPNSNCIVLFVHGHLLEDALNRTPDNKKTKGKKRNVWKTARNEKQKRRNLSIHSIGYNDDGTKTIHTNHQLRHLPFVDQNLVNTYLRKIDIADPMFKCKYKYHNGNAQIVSRANKESQKNYRKYPRLSTQKKTSSGGHKKTRRNKKLRHKI